MKVTIRPENKTLSVSSDLLFDLYWKDLAHCLRVYIETRPANRFSEQEFKIACEHGVADFILRYDDPDYQKWRKKNCKSDKNDPQTEQKTAETLPKR